MDEWIQAIRKGSSEYPLKQILNFKGLSVRPSHRYRPEWPTQSPLLRVEPYVLRGLIRGAIQGRLGGERMQ